MLPLPAIQNMPSPVDSAQAQQLKQFSLEDLNFGGTNYRNMIPANMYLTWWGDRLMYQDAEEWGTVDMKTGQNQSGDTRRGEQDSSRGQDSLGHERALPLPRPDVSPARQQP